MEWFFRHGEKVSGSVFGADEKKGSAKTMITPACGRCGGAGGAEKWRHTGWTCYECGGSGRRASRDVPVYTAEKLAKLDAAKSKADAKRQAAADAKRAEAKAAADALRAPFMAANSEVIAAARTYADRSTFLTDLLRRLDSGLTLWSDGQVAAVAKTVAAMAATDAKRAASEFVGKIGERINIKATIEYVAEFTGRDYYGQSTLECLVTMRDEAGNAFVAKNVRGKKGDKLTIRGTIKDHKHYRDEKQTWLFRVKELELERAEGSE